MALIRTIRQLTSPLAFPDEPNAHREHPERFEEAVPTDAGDAVRLLTNAPQRTSDVNVWLASDHLS